MKKTLDPFDAALDARLRGLRMLIGVTQRKLAQDMGVSFQQLQKYEAGENRMTASKVDRAARALKVTASYLMGETAGFGGDPLDGAIAIEDTSRLFDAWRRIGSERDRRILLRLARDLAAPVKP